MPYITTPLSPAFKQISLEDILAGEVDVSKYITKNKTNTKTVYASALSSAFLDKFDIDDMINKLCVFTIVKESLIKADKKALYSTFYMEKKGKGMSAVFKTIFSSQKKYVGCDANAVCRDVSAAMRPLLDRHDEKAHLSILRSTKKKVFEVLTKSGFDTDWIDFSSLLSSSFRKINAPEDELKDALRSLSSMLEGFMMASHHTSAFAYVKGRCTIDSIKRHQQNESRWFLKLDFSDFFGSTTKEFVMARLSDIFPFSEIIKNPDGERALSQAVDLCFLNGGLPQGTPISPTITNIMMIPIDHTICNDLKKMDGHYVYTRYADDLLISSRFDFDYGEVQKHIIGVLKQFKAPFSIKKEKTRYGSSAGRNWNLGVMLNKDNEITIGWEKKRVFKAMCCNYICDKKNGKKWDLHDVQVLLGLISYYRMIEKDYVDYVLEHHNKKFDTDIEEMIREDLK